MDYSLTTQTINDFSHTLERVGYLHLKNFNEDACLPLIQQFGRLLLTTDVVVNPEKRNLVTSSEALDFHTDHFKARYIAWYCIKQTDLGGESKLIDAKIVYDKLSASQQQSLQEIHLLEHKMFEDDAPSNPLVTMVNGEPHFYYSFWLVKEDERRNTALAAFRRGLANEKSIRLKLEPNDILIIDNHRILHGRTAIKGSKDRFLKRFWIA